MKRSPIKIATKLHQEGYKVQDYDAVLNIERKGMIVGICSPEADSQVIRLLKNLEKNGNS